MIHEEQHPQSGQTVQVAILFAAAPQTLNPDLRTGTDPVTGALLYDFVVDDWEDRMIGSDETLWERDMVNHAQVGFVFRLGQAMAFGLEIPRDGENVYGHIGHLGFIIHATEFVS